MHASSTRTRAHTHRKKNNENVRTRTHLPQRRVLRLGIDARARLDDRASSRHPRGRRRSTVAGNHDRWWRCSAIRRRHRHRHRHRHHRNRIRCVKRAAFPRSSFFGWFVLQTLTLPGVDSFYYITTFYVLYQVTFVCVRYVDARFKLYIWHLWLV